MYGTFSATKKTNKNTSFLILTFALRKPFENFKRNKIMLPAVIKRSIRQKPVKLLKMVGCSRQRLHSNIQFLSPVHNLLTDWMLQHKSNQNTHSLSQNDTHSKKSLIILDRFRHNSISS